MSWMKTAYIVAECSGIKLSNVQQQNLPGFYETLPESCLRREQGTVGPNPNIPTACRYRESIDCRIVMEKEKEKKKPYSLLAGSQTLSKDPPSMTALYTLLSYWTYIGFALGRIYFARPQP